MTRHLRQARTGSVDPFKRPDGSVYYRGRIRLGDGSLHRLTIEEPFCNDVDEARKYTAATQAEEDTHGAHPGPQKRRTAAPRACDRDGTKVARALGCLARCQGEHVDP
jgi:hypothetical protein